jgi:hypothetical protein
MTLGHFALAKRLPAGVFAPPPRLRGVERTAAHGGPNLRMQAPFSVHTRQYICPANATPGFAHSTKASPWSAQYQGGVFLPR